MKLPVIGAVTNRKAVTSTSCSDGAPFANPCTIDAINSDPTPSVDALVGACRRDIEVSSRISPIEPTRVNSAPIISRAATTISQTSVIR